MEALTRRSLLPDPLRQFAAWFEEARQFPHIDIPEAMCLSTVDPDGSPDGRMVMLRGFDARGLVFYTNVRSVKGKSLLAAPAAALTFYWKALGRQVRIRGRTELVSDAEADAYFRTRPRPAQIGAWASEQSELLESRAVLDRRAAELTEKFEGREVPRPPFWTGFRVIPHEFEFWQAREDRLHDRFRYIRTPEDRWETVRLYP